jgi:hypothetical protein
MQLMCIRSALDHQILGNEVWLSAIFLNLHFPPWSEPTTPTTHMNYAQIVVNIFGTESITGGAKLQRILYLVKIW